MNIDWKKIAPELAIVGIFIIASAIYFFPALEGKVIYGGDNINGTAAIQEGWNYYAQTGEMSYWTNAQFSGMPAYQVGGCSYKARQILDPIYRFFHWGAKNVYFLMLFYLIAFYALMRSFKVDKWLSLAGSFAITLSSYFFVIIAATHNAKSIAITWMTMAIVGFLLTMRHKYALGAILMMFFIPLGLYIHPQMGYYICMLIGVLYIAELYIHIRAKEWKHLGIATLVFVTSFAVGLGIGASGFFANQEYAKETMRGGHSDLEKVTDEKNKTKGLDLDYATAWSYGKSETMTFLIPNFMGGASGYNVGDKSVLYQELVRAGVPRSQAKQFCQAAPTYRGEKAFTSGPVYVGAIVCFLFLLGLLIVPGPYKWALLVATLFSLFLSWGKNMMWLTELFFNYFPMYNKFRAVESILIVAEITMPILALLGVQQLINNKEHSKQYSVYILATGGITALICLVCALFGDSIFTLTSSYDNSWKAQVGNEIYQMILDQRAAMLTADAWRSFGFVAIATLLLFFYVKKPFKTVYLGLALTALVIADMWPVDKRFCNNSMFVSIKERDKAFKMQPWEQQILQDKDYYRVFNLTGNPFNEARTGYRLHSVGGYSAAKLRRYQDLIDEHLSKMNMNVYNMLNTRYFVVKGRDGGPQVQYNPEAFGNAWFVDSVLVVNNANEESEALKTLDLKHIAVMDSTFARYALTKSIADPTAEVKLTSYSPKQLEYQTNSMEEKTLVFSEIYYPYGWKATIDGNAAEIFRVNYMLRAMNVPAGEHKIVMVFDPDSVRKGDIVAISCIAILCITMIGTIGYYIYRRKKETAA